MTDKIATIVERMLSATTGGRNKLSNDLEKRRLVEEMEGARSQVANFCILFRAKYTCEMHIR